MDKRSYSRFVSFQNSLTALLEVRGRDIQDSFVLSGAGAKFNITFDLAWKVMKDIIIQEYEIVDFVKGSPREVLRRAFECGIISDDDWMQMMRERNDLTNDYDGTIVKEVCVRVLSKYLELFEEFESRAADFLGNQHDS